MCWLSTSDLGKFSINFKLFICSDTTASLQLGLYSDYARTLTSIKLIDYCVEIELSK